MEKVAGALSLLLGLRLGLGFGLPCAVGILHFAKTGEVWTFVGFPSYGGGPFERAGIRTGVPLLIAFLVVCIAEVAVGVMLLTAAPHAIGVSWCHIGRVALVIVMTDVAGM
jgi:hypothetical protein